MRQGFFLVKLFIFCLSLRNCCKANDSENCSFLERARALQAPVASSTLHGETEASDFWANHSSLLKSAWNEWELQQDDLPPLEMNELVNDTVRVAVKAAWKNPRKEDAVKKLWTEVAPNVYKCQLFNAEQLYSIRKHLDGASYSANIPSRRPNGMNRYGLILHPNDIDGSVVLQEFNGFLTSLLGRYIRPMGRALFPEYTSSKNRDDSNAYAFSIRYKEGEDVSLKEHSDASLYTLNVNLNLPEEHYEGSSLYFVDNGGAHYNVTMKPGQALLHLGMTRHAAVPLKGAGSRTNMVVWLFGKDGDVRIAPYEKRERLSRKQRWSTNKEAARSNDGGVDFEL